MYVYSDLKRKENIDDPTYTRKHFYRKISIFNDNQLDKSISLLKESVQKKNQFIKKYNESQRNLTKKLKECANSIERNNNKNFFMNNNNKDAKSRHDKSNIEVDNHKNSDFIAKENKRRKKNYNLDFKNVVTIKNIDKDKVLKYEYDTKNIVSNVKEYYNNKNDYEKSIYDKIKAKIISEGSYKNLTNFNNELKIAEMDKPVENKKYDSHSSNKISENSIHARKVLDELIDNVEKVYSIDCLKGIDNSQISSTLFKKVNKITNKNHPRRNKKSKNESSFFYNEERLNKSNSFGDMLTSESNGIDNPRSFDSSLNKKKKQDKKYNSLYKNEIEKNNNTYNQINKSENRIDLLDKLKSMQLKTINTPKPNSNNKDYINNLNKSPNTEIKRLSDSLTGFKCRENNENTNPKTPKNIKREMQKIFKMNKGEEFHYREVNNDPELIKQMIINLLRISKTDIDAYKHYREISKSLILEMKDKVYFWQNVMDFLYPKVFKNKLNHKKAEERILGEGLFKLNIEDLRYHKNNKSLQLELRNNLYGEEKAEMNNEKSKNEIYSDDNNHNINTKDNLFYVGKNYYNDKKLKSDNSVIDRNVIFRNPQQSNFTENAQRVLKPSTLNKINNEKRIKLTHLSRKNQMHSENVFLSNSSNARLNVSNLNYIPRINSNDNSEIRTSGKNFGFMKKSSLINNKDSGNPNNYNHERFNHAQLKDDKGKLHSNQVNLTKIKDNSDVNKPFNLHEESKINQKENSNIIFNNDINDSMLSDLLVNQNNKKDFAEGKLMSRRSRGHHQSIDSKSELNDISRIFPLNSNHHCHLFPVTNNNKNNVIYINSYNNESLTTNLDNTTNLNVTEMDKNINNNIYYNYLSSDTNKISLNKIKSIENLINTDRNPQEKYSKKNDPNQLKKITDKNSFNKLSNYKQTNNANEIKTTNLNSETSKTDKSTPYTVNTSGLNPSLFKNHYESNKINNKKETKAFQVVAPMLISSIPRYDL